LIQINRHGHLDSSGLPICRFKQIQPSTTSAALAACRRSLVGEGSFSADVELPQQAPFPSQGKVLAFNARVDGRPVILATSTVRGPFSPPMSCPSRSAAPAVSLALS
jgi:hypothetical protein